MGAPRPPEAGWPRYSQEPLPRNRYLPGRSPHPRRAGRAPGDEPRAAGPFDVSRWRECNPYRYAVDLYNFGFWWEAHEAFENLWRAAGRDTDERNFFRAMVQVGAANLKRFLGADAGARRLAHKAVERLRVIPDAFMGVDVASFASDVERHFEGRGPGPVLVALGSVGDDEPRKGNPTWPMNR